MIVVDASAAIAWAIPSQSTPAAAALAASAQPFIAPTIFEVELRNVLLKAERRGWLSQVQSERALLEIQSMIEPLATQSTYDAIMVLARSNLLSMFDAYYLDLALQENAPLASRDVSLIGAAQTLGVAVHDLR